MPLRTLHALQELRKYPKDFHRRDEESHTPRLAVKPEMFDPSKHGHMFHKTQTPHLHLDRRHLDLLYKDPNWMFIKNLTAERVTEIVGAV